MLLRGCEGRVQSRWKNKSRGCDDHQGRQGICHSGVELWYLFADRSSGEAAAKDLNTSLGGSWYKLGIGAANQQNVREDAT